MLTKITWVNGDTVKWNTSYSDYPSSAWTLTVYLNGFITGSFTGSAASDNIGFNVTASAALTAALATGSYQVTEIATSGSERYTLSTTTITILPNPATADNGYDPRSHVRKVYEAIQACIEGRATSAESSITIAGRSLTRIPMSELLVMYKKYQELVRQEEQAERLNKGLAAGNKVLVRFI